MPNDMMIGCSALDIWSHSYAMTLALGCPPGWAGTCVCGRRTFFQPSHRCQNSPAAMQMQGKNDLAAIPGINQTRSALRCC